MLGHTLLYPAFEVDPSPRVVKGADHDDAPQRAVGLAVVTLWARSLPRSTPAGASTRSLPTASTSTRGSALQRGLPTLSGCAPIVGPKESRPWPGRYTGHLRFLRRDLGIRTPMRTMGVIATGLLVVLGVTVGVLGIASIPDIKRYIKIHEM